MTHPTAQGAAAAAGLEDLELLESALGYAAQHHRTIQPPATWAGRLHELLPHLRVEQHQPEGSIYLQGQAAVPTDGQCSYYVVRTGTVELWMDSQLIETVGSGFGFGDVAFSLGVPRTATAITGPDGAELLALDRRDYEGVLHSASGGGIQMSSASSIVLGSPGLGVSVTKAAYIEMDESSTVACPGGAVFTATSNFTPAAEIAADPGSVIQCNSEFL